MANNRYYNMLYNRGVAKVKDKKIVFCGCIRDAGNELKTNIPTIERIAAYFEDYRIVVVENNSVDNSKQVLREWGDKNSKVIPLIYDFDESEYQAIPKEKCYHSAFSHRRLKKFIDYRNIYCDYVENKLDFIPDYYTVIDFDLRRIDVKGFITSFGSDVEWDAVTANGYSYSSKLKRRYHDTYPLFESLKQKDSEEKIDMYREAYEPLRKGMPFVRVASAYDGIAIFRAKIRIPVRYKIIFNNYGGVEVYCDHVTIFKQLAEMGYDKVYINPNMEVYYQGITFKLIVKKIKDLIHGYY